MRNKASSTTTNINQRDCFNTIIDARSPAEFALDHIPGAINCPVLNDEERIIVGTLFKQKGAFEAKRVGGAMVAANLAQHLKHEFADKPAKWKPLVYCWRGGMRSGSMVTWLRLVGWDAQQLAGGYKYFRHHVIAQIETLSQTAQFKVICGATGSAKTRLLQALAEQGEQIINLEEIACHKGSILGNVPGQQQPSQKKFETQIAAALETFDMLRPIYIEGESRKIGRLALPNPLLEKMRISFCIEISATPQARLNYLLRDYAYLGSNPELLIKQLAFFTQMQGKQIVERWQNWVLKGQLDLLFSELMQLHYDPHYARSQSKNFVQWQNRIRFESSDLSEQGISELAHRIAHYQS